MCYLKSNIDQSDVPLCVTVGVLPEKVLPEVKSRRKWCSPVCYRWGVTRKCVTRSQKTTKVIVPPALPPLQCCFSLPTVSHILDSMACEGCRHLRDAEDDPGTEPVAKSVGVPRAAIPKADSAHGAGKSEDDLYSGFAA